MSGSVYCPIRQSELVDASVSLTMVGATALVCCHPAAVIPRPREHGGDAKWVAQALGIPILDLSISMNPFAPPVPELAAGHLDALNRYPEPTDATALVAEVMGVPVERLLLTNGGSEAIALLAAVEPRGWVVEPEFSLYRRHLGEVDPAGLRWRSNPSNPLGTLAAATDQADVWDEAFYPLATGEWTRGDEGSWRLGSLTKLWTCPGLRIGYLIAPTAEQKGLAAARQPHWSVNGLVLDLMAELLARTDLPGWARAVAQLRQQLTSELRGLGYRVRDTQANWLLFDEAAGLRERLAPHGVLVRDCTSFGLPDVARMGLPLPTEVDRVVSAFAAAQRSKE
jgi:histidinol-phosphate/aromatic aminotransferase/cobyric acid decarboxylase-like protein